MMADRLQHYWEADYRGGVVTVTHWDAPKYARDDYPWDVWLDSDAASGEYLTEFVCFITIRGRRMGVQLNYHFTDPNTAMEFKLRFA